MDSAANLIRFLLYTDKMQMKEFGLPQNVGDELYELFVTTKDDFLEYRHGSVLFFNEVFYQLTTIYDDPAAAEHVQEYITDFTSLYPHRGELYEPGRNYKEAEDYEEKAYKANIYLFGFVWLILKKQRELPRLVKFFLKALEAKLPDDGVLNLNKFKQFYKEHPEPIDVIIAPQPDFHMASSAFWADVNDWECATNDFDYHSVRNIVHRFGNIEERKKIIEIIRTHLHESNQKPETLRAISRTTNGRKITDVALNNLISEADDEAIYKTQEQSATHLEGFLGFITKDHQRVLSILMLVNNMGTRQMPIMIKFIKAFQKLGYIREDCFENLDDFVKKARNQFEGTNFDISNVRKEIVADTKQERQKYMAQLETITHHLKTVMEG